MAQKNLQEWDLWYPKAAANGLPFGRSRIDPVEFVLVHSAPDILTVTVRDGAGKQQAQGVDLARAGDAPITRLSIAADTILREEVWPGPEDLGSVVLFPGGEAGILCVWQHKPDHSEWRWRVEFFNRK